MMQRSLLVLFILFSSCAFAQDTLLLLSGRKIVVRSVDLKDYTIAYRKLDPNSKKLKTINPERVFSVLYRDGRERVIYQTDSLDPLDFTVDEMRLFIKGEQDAREFYRNTPVKVSGFIVGGAFSLLGFYGLIGPPLFSTVMGSFSPDVEKKLTFKVSGTSSGETGIEPGKYLNVVTGSKENPVFQREKTLNINSTRTVFENDTPLDTAVTIINGKFNSHRVHAANNNGNLTLYRSSDPTLIAKNPYREGFEKRVRDYKIRYSMLSGMIGFLVTSAVLSLFLESDNPEN